MLCIVIHLNASNNRIIYVCSNIQIRMSIKNKLNYNQLFSFQIYNVHSIMDILYV